MIMENRDAPQCLAMMLSSWFENSVACASTHSRQSATPASKRQRSSPFTQPLPCGRGSLGADIQEIERRPKNFFFADCLASPSLMQDNE
jgi:hypothetical protein